MSQEKLAYDIGYSRYALRNWLNGTSSISAEDLDRLCQHIHIDIDDQMRLFQMANYPLPDRLQKLVITHVDVRHSQPSATPTMLLSHSLHATYRAAVGRIVEEYSEVFGGRQAELAALDELLDDPTHPRALLLAPTGRGKTALLIHWAALVQQRSNWHVILAPISQRFQTADERTILNILAHGLADLHGKTEELRQYDPTPDNLRPLIAEWLAMPLPAAQRLLVVIDGMDEAVGWEMERILFPRTLPAGVQIVASARAMAHRTPADWREQLGWRTPETADIALPLLPREAVAQILAKMGNPLDALATQVDVLAQIARISVGEPLTIRLLIEALRDGEVQPDELPNTPRGLEAFMRRWLNELEHNAAAQPEIHTLLRCCAAAHGPLSAEDLARLAPQTLGVRAKLNQAAKAVGRFVLGDGKHHGYVFSHPKLRELYWEQVLSPTEQGELQIRFAADIKQWGDTAHTNGRLPPLSDYQRQYGALHLGAVGDWATMRMLVAEGMQANDERWMQPWASARLAAEGSYAGYLSDIERLWAHADQTKDLVLAVHCTLIQSSIRTLSANLTPELLVGLVTVGTPDGKWSAEAALEYIMQTPEYQQVESIDVLLQAQVGLPIDRVLDSVCLMVDEQYRANGLMRLASVLPPDPLRKALAAAWAIQDE